MATSDQLQEVRYYTALDPYYYTVDNRPLTDLNANTLSLAQGVDAAKNASLVGSVATGILTSGLIGNDDVLVSDITLPGGLTVSLSQGFLATKRAISTVDTRQITKLSLLVDGYSNTLAGPVGAGNSIVHLIQMRHVDVTTGTDGLPQYDPFNPHATGSIMTGVVEVSVKSGVEATTSTEVAPTADAGWVGILEVTIADTTVNLTTDNLNILAAQAIGSAAGGSGDVASATETSEGIVELATPAEVQALSDTVRAVTPAGLASLTATEDRIGMLEIATVGQAQALTSTDTIMTPAKLRDAFNANAATTSELGTILLADNTVTNAGTDSERAVTPASLAYTLNNFDFTGQLDAASTTVSGIVELAAVGAETINTNDQTRAVTPAGLADALANVSISVSDASTSVKGIVQLATSQNVKDKASSSLAVTPSTLWAALSDAAYLPSTSTTTRGMVRFANTTELSSGVSTAVALSLGQLNDNFANLSGAAFSGNISAGDITATGTLKGATVRATSAREYKTEIETLENALDLCSKLRGVSYTWKVDGTPDIGFIADEIDEVFPFLVSKDEDGRVQAMDYLHLGAIFANAINELNVERQQDKALIAKLMERVEALEAKA